jgi:hypothetical protein
MADSGHAVAHMATAINGMAIQGRHGRATMDAPVKRDTSSSFIKIHTYFSLAVGLSAAVVEAAMHMACVAASPILAGISSCYMPVLLELSFIRSS